MMMGDFIKKIDGCLSTRNGRLFIDECDTVDLVKRFGSPLYVISEKQLRYNICGRTCYADRIFPEVRFPEVRIGDVIAICDTGAYQEVSACNFNGLPRPATILVTGKDAEIIKRAETLEDVFKRDIVPERLI